MTDKLHTRTTLQTKKPGTDAAKQHSRAQLTVVDSQPAAPTSPQKP